MNDPYDMERFHDPCEDTRTESQIVWEEGLLRNNPVFKIWCDNFGKNDFYKFGKKIGAMLMIMLFWTGFSIIVGENGVEAVINVIVFTCVNAVSIWFYRTKEGNGKFTPLNMGYIALCAAACGIFYRYFDVLFGYFGHAILLSFYYGVYFISRNTAVIVRIIISAFIIKNIIMYNIEKNEKGKRKWADIAHALCALYAVVIGMVYKLAGAESYGVYIAAAGLCMAAAFMGFVLYVVNKNRYMRNVCFVFAYVSLMEIVGSYAVVSGAMTKYIESGIL